ncbi:MAG: phosphatidate cytidylyltransferase [Pseudomonadota bacterium]
MHFKRWLTGIIAVPALIFIIGPGPGWLFYALIVFASMAGLFEFFSITASGMPSALKLIGFVCAYALLHLIARGPFFMLLPFFSLFAVILLAVYLFAYPARRHQAVEDIGKMLLGLVYICLPLSLLIFISKHPRGDLWIFFLLCVTFFCDSFAFYAGRSLGRHKLYPSISPGKTWEGALGGLLGSLLGACLFALFFPIVRINLKFMALAAALSLAGQIGDLAESMLKRNYGVKDSGKILPGHGGILDRVDSLLFSIPILYLFLSWS